MTFVVRWPDGVEQRCYSPSLVVHDYLQPGVSYDVSDFLTRSRTALTIASDRVQAKYGFACTSAAASIAGIEHAASRYAGEPAPQVTVTAFE